MILSLLLACTGATDSAKPEDSGTADTMDSGTADTETTYACGAVNPGDDWAWTGECPQMTTPVAITVDGCTLTLDYDSVGGMTMGMPFSATIQGDTVTFADDNSVDGCVATIETADKMSGACADGCTFKLKR
jgi:hypothetical protein